MINPVDAIEKFRHQILEKVKFHEVDMLGICNNAVYFDFIMPCKILKKKSESIKNYKLLLNI